MALVERGVEATVRDVMVEDVGDLELAASGGCEAVDDVERVGAQEVHADRDQVGLRRRRLLLESDHPAVGVQLGDTEALRIGHPVQECAGTPRPRLEGVGDVRQGRAAQDVVAEHAAEHVVAHEPAREADRVGDAERAALVAVREVKPEMRAVAEQLDDVAHALAADHDEHLADAHRRERLDRVVDHRPVIDRQQVLVGDDRQRVEPRCSAAGEHDFLHWAEAYQPLSAGSPPLTAPVRGTAARPRAASPRRSPGRS